MKFGRRQKIASFILATIVGILTIFWPSIATTATTISTKIITDDIAIDISSVPLGTTETLSSAYHAYKSLLFKLPFDNPEEDVGGETYKRFISKESVFAIVDKKASVIDFELSCEKFADTAFCEEYGPEVEEILNSLDNHSGYLETALFSENDISVFDSRKEKILESIRLIIKNELIPTDFDQVKTFDGEKVSGVIFSNVDEDRIIAELFTELGPYTVVTKNLSENEILEIFSSIDY